MRIAYMYTNALHGHEVDEQRRMAAASIASVRKHMASMDVIHLTDMSTPALHGVNTVIRDQWGGPVGKNNRADWQANLSGDVLILDTDTLIMQDVRSVFDDKDFDVALPIMPKPADGGDVYPYNQGVVFSRCPAFWTDVAEQARLLGFYSEDGFNRVVTNGKYRIKHLDIGYNFAPPHSLSIMHFKGHRKRLMETFL